MTATANPAQADSKATDEAKTDDKPKTKTKGSKPSKTKPTPAPTNEAISKAMQTLADAGLMSQEDQMEAAVAFKLTGIYSKIVTIIATVGVVIPEGHGIALFSDGGFGIVEDDGDEDEDEDEQPRGKKKGKKGKKAKAKNDDEGDWKADAAIIQKALIKFMEENDKKAQDIHDLMGKRNATPPALTTIYNWTNGKSLPNRKYHRKLRSILGLNVG